MTDLLLIVYMMAILGYDAREISPSVLSMCFGGNNVGNDLSRPEALAFSMGLYPCTIVAEDGLDLRDFAFLVCVILLGNIHLSDDLPFGDVLAFAISVLFLGYFLFDCDLGFAVPLGVVIWLAAIFEERRNDALDTNYTMPLENNGAAKRMVTSRGACGGAHKTEDKHNRRRTIKLHSRDAEVPFKLGMLPEIPGARCLLRYARAY
ncbi:hypothetical protein P171DRAFT_442962 [Karstenula rhodostoma CBS 690.94]|uniref:Sodium/calcium exchanger membrane region domain-containing protein n=1 Tax=Karstenula rhodostoma CBS 690.94 TaxID=1392251 RepID=A0A9P4PME0_9PLEO|nr:hypothetical protein P171DRAFT_442962 [Karstenula rhodostoma CBS 690.94]